MDLPIYVRLRDTRSGRSELRYAAALAALTGGPLTVVLPFTGESHILTSIVWGACETMEIAETEDARIRGRLGELGIDFDRVAFIGDMAGFPFAFPKEALLVGNFLRADDRAVLRAVPFDQSRPKAADRALRIMVPFAGGPSGLRAASAAARFGQALGGNVEVTLYHTTWPDPDVVSDIPSFHMCEEVEKRQARVETELLGFSSQRSLIEMTEDVPGGILRAALRLDIDLIVMARGASTARGSYVDRVLSRSTVPVLIAPEEART